MNLTHWSLFSLPRVLTGGDLVIPPDFVIVRIIFKICKCTVSRFFHGLRAGWRMGTASLKDKLLHHLEEIREEVLY